MDGADDPKSAVVELGGRARTAQNVSLIPDASVVLAKSPGHVTANPDMRERLAARNWILVKHQNPIPVRTAELVSVRRNRTAATSANVPRAWKANIATKLKIDMILPARLHFEWIFMVSSARLNSAPNQIDCIHML